MKKDAYYFPHFSNSRNDPKILKLTRVLGLEGYAMYFMLLELLRDQDNFRYPLSGIEDVAYSWHVSKEKVLSVITSFELFEIDTDNFFFSFKFNEYMEPWLNQKAKLSLAGIASGEKRRQLALQRKSITPNEHALNNSSTSDEHTLNMCSTCDEHTANKCETCVELLKKRKEIKEIKEIKEKNKDWFFSFLDSFQLSEKLKSTYIDFFQMRKKIKKPIKTQSAVKMQLDELAKHDEETAIAMLQNSIKNEWQGIFEIKTQAGGTKPKESLMDKYNRLSSTIKTE